MALYKVCSVYDQKAEAYMRPMFVQASGAAMRGFADEVNSGNKESPLATHPEDFVLFEIATWDDVHGKLAVYETPRPLCSGIDTKRTGDSPLRSLQA